MLETLLATGVLTLVGCAGVKTFMALDEKDDRGKPIQNPFGVLYPAAGGETGGPVVVRSKKGDRALEVEIPARNSEISEWVVPVGDPAQAGVADAGPKPARDYADRKPSSLDRDIQRRMPQLASEDVAARREIEAEMGLQPVEEDLPRGDKSYLGALDRIKSLFREGRYEAALLESEDMLRDHPTDPRLHEMKGTLLDRLGYADLARQSWAQSLKLQPSNEPLRRFLERRGVRMPASAQSVQGGESP